MAASYIDDVADRLGITVDEADLEEFSALKTIISEQRRRVDGQHMADVVTDAVLAGFRLGKVRP